MRKAGAPSPPDKGGVYAAKAAITELITRYAAKGGGLPVLSAGPPLVGSFHDSLVRTAHGWRFAERRGSLNFRAPLPG
jgi:hypothetical protein